MQPIAPAGRLIGGGGLQRWAPRVGFATPSRRSSPLEICISCYSMSRTEAAAAAAGAAAAAAECFAKRS